MIEICLSHEKLIPRISLAGGWEIGMCNSIILEDSLVIAT